MCFSKPKAPPQPTKEEQLAIIAEQTRLAEESAMRQMAYQSQLAEQSAAKARAEARAEAEKAKIEENQKVAREQAAEMVNRKKSAQQEAARRAGQRNLLAGDDGEGTNPDFYAAFEEEQMQKSLLSD